MTALLTVSGLAKRFPIRRAGFDLLKSPPLLHAVEAVDFSIQAGEAVGLVGESGCGKSTLARLAARLIEPTAGKILLDGADVTAQSASAFTASPARRAIQMVFQDPTESLNPRFTVFDAIADPVRVMVTRERAEISGRVAQAAAQVDLSPALFDRYPHQLSGGQKARVGLARAMAVSPRLLVLDEPTSALDVSVQATVLKLLAKLRREAGVALLFVSHDLTVVRLLCDRILIMYLGQIVESGPADAIFTSPRHPYSQALLSAAPDLRRKRAARERLAGEPQSPIDPDPHSCRLYGRCPRQEERCRVEAPALREIGLGRGVRCHFA
jgi:oligopeptide/dipeptide ABC transporter ATP-binding protein